MDEIPYAQNVTDAIDNYSKKAAGLYVSKFSKALDTAVEPFFRKQMGERYFDGQAAAGGAIVWIVGTIASSFNGLWLSPIASHHNFDALAKFLDHPIWAIIPCCFMIVLYWAFCLDNNQFINVTRTAGTLYHSRSRGVSRWGKEGNVIFAIIVFLVLFVFAPIMAVLFFISCGRVSNAADYQRAVLMNMYLDVKDSEIETDKIQDAALGNCEPQITYLYDQLPVDMKPEIRKDIAAAMVPRSPRIVAKSPMAAKPPEPLTQEPAPPIVSAAPEKPAFQEEPAAESIAPAGPENVKSLKVLGLVGLMLVVGILVIGAAVYHFTKGSSPAPVPGGATKVVEPQKPKLAVVPVVPAPVVQVTVPEPPPIVATPVEPKPQVSAEDAANAAKAVAAAEKARADEALLGKIKSLIDGDADKIAKFKIDSETKLADNAVQIKAVSFFRRGSLTKANDLIKVRFEGLLASQEQAVTIFRAQLPLIGKPKEMTHQEFLTRLESILSAMEKNRILVLSSIDEVTSGIAKKSVQRGLQ